MFTNFVKTSRTLKIATIAGILVFAGTLSQAQSNIEAIIRNIQPVGQVCLTGQNCSGSVSGSATAATTTHNTQSEPAAMPAFDVAATYQLSCFACHGSGAAGAPVTGDAEAWGERMDKGIDVVLANAMNGTGAMPAKGMCMDCTEDNIRSLIDFMVEGGQ
ncbi:MAG: cytochrome c5 family protein [Gammaproteobacteria bacterium]|nr:cytochrome c5 family protein [Gammaproteobacteria bacterium]